MAARIGAVSRSLNACKFAIKKWLTEMCHWHAQSVSWDRSRLAHANAIIYLFLNSIDSMKWKH